MEGLLRKLKQGVLDKRFPFLSYKLVKLYRSIKPGSG
jgi:hypothetical protein